MFAATDAQARNAPARKLHSSIRGASLLAGALLGVAMLASPAISAERPTVPQNQYLIFFTPESATITPAAQVILDKAVEDAAAAGNALVSIKAYAAGNEAESAALAAERAQAVAMALAADGVEAKELRVQSVTVEPAPQVTAQIDRRVEIRLEPRQPAFSALQKPWVTAVR